MRQELDNREWRVMKPMLPNKPRGVTHVNDGRVLNGISWVLRSGAPWRGRPSSVSTLRPQAHALILRRPTRSQP